MPLLAFGVKMTNKKIIIDMVIGDGTVAEHLSNHPKVKSSSLACTSGARRVNGKKY